MMSIINIINTTMTSFFTSSCAINIITIMLYNSSATEDIHISSNNNHSTNTTTFTNGYNIIVVDVAVPYTY